MLLAIFDGHGAGLLSGRHLPLNSHTCACAYSGEKQHKESWLPLDVGPELQGAL